MFLLWPFLQLYRMLWIYIAIHDLGRASSSKGSSKPGNPAYRIAAIKIAQELTPLLVAGGELDIEQVEAGKSSLSSVHKTLAVSCASIPQ